MKNTLRLTVAAFGLAAFNVFAASVIQFSALSYNVTEGVNAQVVVAVQRTNDLDTVLSVDFATTTNGTATASADYAEVSTKLILLANETNKLVAVPILNDGFVEGIETFQVALSNPTAGAVLGDRTNAMVRITDNDKGLQLTAASYSVSEEAGTVAIGVLRGDDGDYPITVDLTTSDGTGIAGVDYVGMTNTLQFVSGEILTLVPIVILNDAAPESSKTFRVTLTSLTGGGRLGSPTTATVTITDKDEVVQLEFGNYYVGEEAEFVRIGVLRGESDAPATVSFQATDVTATAGLDYIGVTNTIAFAAGERLKLIDVPILNDGLKEANETFRVTLANPTGSARLGAPVTASVTIADNDAGAQFEWSLGWGRETEGAYAVKVLRGNDGQMGAFTVDYATTNLTAFAGQDYAETQGTLAFAEGETVQWLTIPLLCLQPTEPDRKFKILLSNPSGGMVLGANSNRTVTILGTLGTVSHSFDGITVLPDQSVQLTLSGGVHKRFAKDFDLYPLEVSTNLFDWAPLVTFRRTNSSTNALIYVDPEAPASSQRFYRTVTNHLITPMLKPTGTGSLGMVNRWLTDPTRRNRFRVSTNGSFMVQIWYPAKLEAGRLPVSYEDTALLHDPDWLGAFLDREPYYVSYSVAGASCASDGGPYPVVLLSHGLGAFRYQMAEKAENLASHGYIFVGIDHFDAGRPVYADGSVGNFPAPSMTTAGVQDRVKDLSFVLDQLAIWNSTDPMFAGSFDLTRVAVMGFSWGGYTAAEFCRVDPRCQAAIPLDPGGEGGPVLVEGLQKPFLQINNGSNSDTTLYAKAIRDAVWFQISSTEHGNFADFYWWSFPASLASAREATRTVNAYTLWFLNKYLKGSTDPMPALADYPRIINFKQK